MKASHTIRPVFDDPNVVSDAGLVPVLRLAESAGLYDLLDDQLGVASPNATVKAASVVGGMLAGADSIDDLDLLRHGGMPRLVRRGAGAVDVGHIPAVVHPRARAAARRHRRGPAGGPDPAGTWGDRRR